jgi:hypothetical protein
MNNIKRQNTRSFWFQSSRIIYYFMLMATCFGHLTVIRSCTRSTNTIHVIWDPIGLTDVLNILKTVWDERFFGL